MTGFDSRRGASNSTHMTDDVTGRGRRMAVETGAETLGAALDYARRGWAVIPVYGVKALGDGRIVCRCRQGVMCDSPGKHAVEVGWQKTEYRTGPDLYPWWDETGSVNGANIGIRTGAVSGIFVIDVDPGRDGYNSLDTLLARGEVGPTRIHKTGSGGIHLLYRLPEGLVVPNSANRLGPGIDVRGENGYVVAPPSTSLKGPYSVVADSGEVMDPPAGLVALVQRLAREKAAGVAVDAVAGDPTFDIALVPPEILAILEEVEVEDRSAVFHNFVGHAMRAGFTQAQVVTAVTPWCQVTGKFYEHGRDRVAQGVAYSWASIESERSRLELVMPDWFHEAMARRREEVNGVASPLHAPTVEPFLRVREGRSLAQIDWRALYKADLAPKWLIPDLFEVGRSYSLYGGPGTGKSLLMFDFVCRLATGRMIDAEGNPVPATPVAYFDRENTPVDLLNRAIALGYESPDDLELLEENLHYFLYPDVALNVREGAVRFVHHVVDCGAQLAVIDTMSRFTEGVKENEAEWVTDFFNYTVVPLKERRVSVVRLDHTGKDHTNGARGTSAKLGDVDGAWLLSYDDKSQIVDLQREKTRSGLGPERLQFRRTENPTSHQLLWVSGGSGDEPPGVSEESTNSRGDTPDRTPAPTTYLVAVRGELRPLMQPLGPAAGRIVDALDELFGDELPSQREAKAAFREAGISQGKGTHFADAMRWRMTRIRAVREGNQGPESLFPPIGESDPENREGNHFWWDDHD